MRKHNPYRYEAGFTIEQHRDELITRLGNAIKRINTLEAELAELRATDHTVQMEETADATAMRNKYQALEKENVNLKIARDDAEGKYSACYAELTKVQAQVADGDLAFNHANEVVGDLQAQVARLSAPSESNETVPVWESPTAQAIISERDREWKAAIQNEGDRISWQGFGAEATFADAVHARLIASRTTPAKEQPWKKGIAIFVAIWIVCGVFNYGAIYADANWRNQNEWPELHRNMRDEIGMVGFDSVLGPLGLGVSIFCTNFLEHGWYMTARDVHEVPAQQ